MDKMKSVPSGTSVEKVLDGDAVIGLVQVITNCPQGGDAGHGGETWISFEYDGCDVPRLAFTAYGDAEARVLARALLWAGSELQRLVGGDR